MASEIDVGILRWRVEMLEAALRTIASPLLEADIDEIRAEAREALRMSQGAALNDRSATAEGAPDKP